MMLNYCSELTALESGGSSMVCPINCAHLVLGKRLLAAAQVCR
jgi:hypothetical protein